MDATVKNTSLSAGAVIRAVLLEDPRVSAITGRVFPVVTDSAELPYIVYRRESMETNPQKSGQPGADTVRMEVTCYASRYGESVELAEAVRGALDFISAEHDGQRLRACYLTDSEEAWQDDAYIQQMIFTIKI